MAQRTAARKCRRFQGDRCAVPARMVLVRAMSVHARRRGPWHCATYVVGCAQLPVIWGLWRDRFTGLSPQGGRPGVDILAVGPGDLSGQGRKAVKAGRSPLCLCRARRFGKVLDAGLRQGVMRRVVSAGRVPPRHRRAGTCRNAGGCRRVFPARSGGRRGPGGPG